MKRKKIFNRKDTNRPIIKTKRAYFMLCSIINNLNSHFSNNSGSNNEKSEEYLNILDKVAKTVLSSLSMSHLAKGEDDFPDFPEDFVDDALKLQANYHEDNLEQFFPFLENFYCLIKTKLAQMQLYTSYNNNLTQTCSYTISPTENMETIISNIQNFVTIITVSLNEHLDESNTTKVDKLLNLSILIQEKLSEISPQILQSSGVEKVPASILAFQWCLSEIAQVCSEIEDTLQNMNLFLLEKIIDTTYKVFSRIDFNSSAKSNRMRLFFKNPELSENHPFPIVTTQTNDSSSNTIPSQLTLKIQDLKNIKPDQTPFAKTHSNYIESLGNLITEEEKLADSYLEINFSIEQPDNPYQISNDNMSTTNLFQSNYTEPLGNLIAEEEELTDSCLEILNNLYTLVKNGETQEGPKHLTLPFDQWHKLHHYLNKLPSLSYETNTKVTEDLLVKRAQLISLIGTLEEQCKARIMEIWLGRIQNDDIGKDPEIIASCSGQLDALIQGGVTVGRILEIVELADLLRTTKISPRTLQIGGVTKYDLEKMGLKRIPIEILYSFNFSTWELQEKLPIKRFVSQSLIHRFSFFENRNKSEINTDNDKFSAPYLGPELNHMAQFYLVFKKELFFQLKGNKEVNMPNIPKEIINKIFNYVNEGDMLSISRSDKKIRENLLTYRV